MTLLIDGDVSRRSSSIGLRYAVVSGELSKTAIRPGGTGHEIRTLGL
jgi:hypothetical protein